jgi:malonate-semialdehyde dehydrogenase (acetylating)/methylmalonate-semialdehyde dehydrogenase
MRNKTMDVMSTARPSDLGVRSARNLIGSEWQRGEGGAPRMLLNPADTRETIGEIVDASPAQVEQACAAAARAFPAWKAVPPSERARVLFRFKELLERNFGELAEQVVQENGKLLSEAKGSVRRGVDVVEFACGIPSLLMGKELSDISRSVDCAVLREPLGVVAAIPPFNFPAMIPLWTMPIAVACGNSFVLKPSEKAPLTATRLAELFVEAGLPPGVLNVVQGGKEVALALVRNEHVRAVSSVGSTAAAESIYRAAAGSGKRVQALGGAKNHLVVMPDADLGRALPALIGSAFGCAGQRCLAGSVLVAVGGPERQREVVERFVQAAKKIRLGAGNDPEADMGPVLGPKERERIVEWIGRGVEGGATLLLDGREARIESHPHGCFVGPTVLDHVRPEAPIAKEEVFGPVVVILRVPDLRAAIETINKSRYGNSASLFTDSGSAVRSFRAEVQCGMLGINLGVPAPMAYFSFAGWKESLFGDLGAHGTDGVEFFTRKKVVTERWFETERPRDGWV